MLKILVVDDGAVTHLLFNAYSREIQQEIHICSVYNGKEAITELAKNKKYDLIIMDIEMPIMNGITATGIIKKKWPLIPVILHSCSDQPALFNNYKSFGFSDILQKPLNPDRFANMLKKHTTLEI